MLSLLARKVFSMLKRKYIVPYNAKYGDMWFIKSTQKAFCATLVFKIPVCYGVFKVSERFWGLKVSERF